MKLSKIISMLLVASLCISFSGCSNKKAADESSTVNSDSLISSEAEDSSDIVVDDTSDEPGTQSSSQSSTSSSGTGSAIDTAGYCAVGTIDEGAKTAKVLFSNGEIKTITYEGTAPQKGIVNKYTMNGDVLKFETIQTFPAFTADFSSWFFGVYWESRNIYYGDSYMLDENSAVFVRYSDTEWRVFKGTEIFYANANSKGYLYSPGAVQGGQNYIDFIMVVGECNALGALKPANKEVTLFLDSAMQGWDTGDKNLA